LIRQNDASHTLREPKTASTAKQELPSVLPLHVDDPLSHLQLFSGLRFLSNTSQLLHTEGTTLRRHHIKGVASGILTFDIHMDVEQGKLTVDALQCTTSLWARSGLSSFLKEASDQGDIHSALYGISSYSVLALERASTFAIVQRRIRDQTDREEVTLQEQLYWLGKPNIVLHPSKGIELVLSWDIEMTSIGDVESHVVASTKVTDTWRRVDGDDSLKKLSPMFHKLVTHMGMEEAAILIHNVLS